MSETRQLAAQLGYSVIAEVAQNQRLSLGRQQYLEAPIPDNNLSRDKPGGCGSGGELAQDEDAPAPDDKPMATQNMPTACRAGENFAQPHDAPPPRGVRAVAKSCHQKG